jgi:hypothetical protein
MNLALDTKGALYHCDRCGEPIFPSEEPVTFLHFGIQKHGDRRPPCEVYHRACYQEAQTDPRGMWE